MAVTPLRRVKKVKKRSKKFLRHEYEDFGKLKATWRRPRGIDSAVRRQFRGRKPLVKIGYGTNKKHKDILPNGFKKFLIRNASELEVLLMNNREYCGELASNLSARKRKDIVQRAAELNVRITNHKGKLVTEDKNAQ